MQSSRANVEETGGKNLTLAITGASGALFARHMLQALEADNRVAHVNLVVSPSALRVLAEESGLNGANGLVQKFLGAASAKIVQLAHQDVGANIASGSYPSDGMIVLPCSMGTLGGIAHGLAQNLIERSADVCLKERRPLILCVRETPLNLIHIRNMASATEAGATIFPVIPTFYNHPQTIDDIAGNYVARILQHLGLRQPNTFTWGEST